MNSNFSLFVPRSVSKPGRFYLGANRHPQLPQATNHPIVTKLFKLRLPSFFRRACHLLHATRYPIFTMSSLSSPSPSFSAPCSYSSHSDPDTLEGTVQPKDTLLQPEDILKEPKDTVPQPENTLLQHDEILHLPQLEDSTMPGRNRSTRRNVHIFNASDRNTEIGGLRTNGITNANLYAMIEIFLFFGGEYVLRDESDIVVKRDDSLLQPGKYYINSPRTSLSNNAFT